MIESFATSLRRFDGDANVVLGAVLAGEFLQELWPKVALFAVFVAQVRRDYSAFVTHNREYTARMF